jgi:hypothetical protein
MSLLTLLSTTPAALAISCKYPMDADSAEVMGIGYYDRLTMSEGDQKASLTVNNALGAEKYFAAFTHNTFDVGAVKIDLTGAGKKVIQEIITIPTLATTGPTVLLTMNVHLYGCFRTEVKCYADGEFEARVYGAAQAFVITKGSMSPGTLLLTHEIDTDAGTFGLRVNGGSLETLTNNTYNVNDVPLFVEIIQANGAFINVIDNGKVIAAEFVTAAPYITPPVTSGYNDACGNAL